MQEKKARQEVYNYPQARLSVVCSALGVPVARRLPRFA